MGIEGREREIIADGESEGKRGEENQNRRRGEIEYIKGREKKWILFINKEIPFYNSDVLRIMRIIQYNVYFLVRQEKRTSYISKILYNIWVFFKEKKKLPYLYDLVAKTLNLKFKLLFKLE